jgi:hypothetical protein
VRKIDLGLNSVGFRPAGTSGFSAGTLSGGPEVLANLFGFMFFQGTGMRFLLGDPDIGQYIENGFALDFQLSGQIVDSNLTHSPLSSSNSSPVKSSLQPHGVET